VAYRGQRCYSGSASRLGRFSAAGRRWGRRRHLQSPMPPDLRQRQTRRKRRSAAPKAEPMAIPAMAPPESFLLLWPFSTPLPPLVPPPPLPLGTGVGDGVCPAGAGDGGTSPGQGPKGPPHKPVPRNAERGCDRSEAGMDPFSWLNETLNCCSGGSFASEISRSPLRVETTSR
jgi:hypothetical protein